MRILAFVYSFPPFQGGSGMGMYDLLKRLAEYDDYQIDVITFNHEDAPQCEELDGMTVFRLSRWQLVGIYHIPKPTKSNIRLLFQATRRHPDVIYTRTRFFFTTLMGLVASFLLKKPMLHTEPGSCRVSSGKWYADLIAAVWDNTIGRLVAKRALCVGVSYASSEYMVSLGARNVRTIYNGVDREIFSPDGATSSLDNQFTVLYAGRLMWTKGIDILNQVADKLNGHARIITVGEGEYPLRQSIESLGFVPPERVAMAMRGASALLLPSRMEGLSRVIQEAMSVGLPVVAADVGGNKELVKHEVTGYLTSLNADEITDYIRRLTDDDALRARMGDAALEASKAFDWHATVELYRWAFRDAVETPAGRIRALMYKLLNPAPARTRPRTLATSLLQFFTRLLALGGIAYLFTSTWTASLMITITFHIILVAARYLFTSQFELRRKND